MNDLVEKIANAVLYEGYILYPYRPSSIKNRQRFNFGVIIPRSYSEDQRGTESWQMQTQVLLSAKKDTTVDVKVRFLQLREREVYAARQAAIRRDAKNGPIEVNGKVYQPWQEAIEREVKISNLDVKALEQENVHFVLPANEEREEVVGPENGEIAAMIFRRQKKIVGDVSVSAEKIGKDVFKITVLISNSTRLEISEMKNRDEALTHSLVSAHTILTSDSGEFISLLEPAAFSEAAAACQNIGTYPVLAGAGGEKRAMLSSPIILYDYPEIAPESPGELFDGTEIDEILTLRILTMTDDEKREMSSVDERARKILERTETMDPAEFMKLHGVLRRPGAFSET
jgi:hypothetical protein